MSAVRAFTFVAAAVTVLSACSSFTTAPASAPDDGGTASADASQQGVTDAGNEGSAPFTELSTAWSFLQGIAADEASVYFTEQDTGFMHVLPLAGGKASVPGGQAVGAPLGVVLVSGSVVWLDGAGKAVRAWRAGNPAMSSAPLAPAPFALAAAAKELVYTLSRDSEAAQLGALQSRPVNQLDVVASRVDGLARPLDLAVRNSDVFVTLSGSSSIGHFLAGASGDLVAQPPLATGETDCTHIAASTLGVVWTSGKGIVRAALAEPSSAGLPTTLASNEVEILALTADDTGFYWLRSDGVLRRWRPGDDSPRTVASGFEALRGKDTHGLALTSMYVVLLTNDGRILRVPK